MSMSDAKPLTPSREKVVRERVAAALRLHPENRPLQDLASALATVESMREGLEDFLKFGIRADTNPTMPGGGRRPTAWWYDYLSRADENVRHRAHVALKREGGQDG